MLRNSTQQFYTNLTMFIPFVYPSICFFVPNGNYLLKICTQRTQVHIWISNWMKNLHQRLHFANYCVEHWSDVIGVTLVDEWRVISSAQSSSGHFLPNSTADETFILVCSLCLQTTNRESVLCSAMQHFCLTSGSEIVNYFRGIIRF